MELSKDAISELRDVLGGEFGEKMTASFSDSDLNHVGLFILTSLAEATKQTAST